MPTPITRVQLPATGKWVSVVDDGQNNLAERVVISFVGDDGFPVDVTASTPLPTAAGASATSPTSVLNPMLDPSVAVSNVDQILIPANEARLGARITNNSALVLYIKEGGVATAGDCDAVLNPGGTYTTDFGFTGVIHGIWSANGSGSARTREFIRAS